MRIIAPAVPVMLAIGSISWAQDADPGCQDSETGLECFNRLVEATAKLQAIAATAVEATNERTEDRTKQKLAPSAPTDGAAALRSFLPQLLTGFGFSEVSDKDGVLSFEHNLGQSHGLDTSIRGTLRDPEPLAAALDSLPVDERADLKKRLEDELGDFDDFEIELTIAPTRRSKDENDLARMGRDFANYQTLFTSVFMAAPTMAQNARFTLAAQLEAVDDADFLTATIEETRGTPSGEAQIQAIEDAAMEVAENHLATAAYLDSSGFFRLADLINNQPQLYFTAKYRLRDDLAGPDSWSLKASWEKGFANVNSLRSFCAERNMIRTNADRSEFPEATCLQQYLEESETKSKAGHRFKIELEYAETDDLLLAADTDGLDFAQAKNESLIASLTYGRYLRTGDEGNAEARLDIEAKYEDVSNDETLNNRFVTTATVNQKLSKDFSLSVGAVYANRPEYRGEVDEELSALLGLKYKLDRAKREGE